MCFSCQTLACPLCAPGGNLPTAFMPHLHCRKKPRGELFPPRPHLSDSQWGYKCRAAVWFPAHACQPQDTVTLSGCWDWALTSTKDKSTLRTLKGLGMVLQGTLKHTGLSSERWVGRVPNAMHVQIALRRSQAHMVGWRLLCWGFRDWSMSWLWHGWCTVNS